MEGSALTYLIEQLVEMEIENIHQDCNYVKDALPPWFTDMRGMISEEEFMKEVRQYFSQQYGEMSAQKLIELADYHFL